MKYFHRTSLPPDAVLAEAQRFFGAHLSPGTTTARSRVYSGAIGRVTVSARAEGGHYTLVTIETDQMGESELDKLAKRCLTIIHKKVEPAHEVRGAY